MTTSTVPPRRSSKTRRPPRPASSAAAVASPLALAGADAALAARLLARLQSAGRSGVDAAELADGLGVDVAPDQLGAALHRLAEEARAVERARRWYAVSATEYSAGRVDLVDGGDALIRPQTHGGRPGQPAFFVDRKHLRGALDGDLVLIKRLRGRAEERAGRRLPPASVVSVAQQRNQRLVGTLETDPDGRRWLSPYDAGKSIDLEVVEASVEAGAGEHGEIPDDHWVVVEVIRGSGSRGSHPRGTVVEHLGAVDAAGTDVAVVLRHYGIPENFPPEVLAAAEKLPTDPSPQDWQGRTDLRDVLTVTIDGETARDFDDAVTCERLGDGRWRFGVHIADVSHYVTPGSALDREAYRRGTSVYYPERAVPMLPERLSNGLCSLRPGVPRLAMSVFLDVDREGRLLRRHFARSVIESDRRLTYTEVARVLEDEQPGDAAEYGAVLPLLRRLREVMEVLHEKRRLRGSIDFDLPSGDVVLDTDGTTVGVSPAERTVAHRIVEEMMIAANEAVAEELEGAGVPILHRVHDAPPQDDLENLSQVLGGFGIRLPQDLERLHPRNLQAALEEAEGTPREGLVSTLVLRTMQRALYSPECRGHYALASRFYAHFTSPIRRYPDLVVHRQLAAWIAEGAGAGQGGVESGPFPLAERLDGIARHASFTERRAEASERDLLQWKKVRFLADRVGESFDGRITGVQPFGLFVQLDDLHVDGLVPIRTLSDDYYLFEPESHRLVGDKKGRVFRLADPVKVRLAGVSLAHRGLDLEIAGLAEPPRRRRGRRG